MRNSEAVECCTELCVLEESLWCLRERRSGEEQDCQHLGAY